MNFDAVDERINKMSDEAKQEQEKLEVERAEKQTELEVIWREEG